MPTVLRQQAKTGQVKALAKDLKPKQLHLSSGKRTTITFVNGATALSSCLSCPDTPCALLSSEDLSPINFEGFPADRDDSTCAVGAINLPKGGGIPIIDSNKCIMCGVCSARCPVGAIRLVTGQGALVDAEPVNFLVDVEKTDLQRHYRTRKLFDAARKTGAHLDEGDAIVSEVFRKLYKEWKLVGDRFPNLLARNLLIGAGVNATMTRKGNNFMRMDMILSQPGKRRGIVEVEFGQDAVLDTPRDILDDLAVLVSRYGGVLNDTPTLIISDVLPNRRSEYWHIVEDVSFVFGVRIETVTILALMLFNWNRMSLQIENEAQFYADRKTKSYRKDVLERVMGRTLKLTTAPRPQVDFVK